MGYICSDQGIVSAVGGQDPLQEDIFADVIETGSTGSTDISEVAQEEGQREEESTGAFRPAVSKEEMVTFLKTKLDLPDAFVTEAEALYDNPSSLKGCTKGFSPAAMEIYRAQIKQALG